LIEPRALLASPHPDERPTRRVTVLDRRIGGIVPLRFVALACLVALAGCSADEVHSPQTFFPGSNRTSWSACGKIGGTGDVLQICADLTLDQATQKPTGYSILFHLPNAEHVRIAVFDARASLVKVLLDSDEAANLPDVFRDPPVDWDFTDAAGARVAQGDYRFYFSAGGIVSTSDVEVP
jgi:hypothetical protein